MDIEDNGAPDADVGGKVDPNNQDTYEDTDNSTMGTMVQADN